jgi:hypothetical protein
VASVGYLPFDQVLLNLIIPVFAHMGLKGVSFQAALICWLISFLAVVASALRVGFMSHIWSVLYSIFFLYYIYEHEKSLRLGFYQVRKLEIVEAHKNLIQREVGRRQYFIATLTTLYRGIGVYILCTSQFFSSRFLCRVVIITVYHEANTCYFVAISHSCSILIH